jgi:alpha-aminoadipate carrier protein LysW
MAYSSSWGAQSRSGFGLLTGGRSFCKITESHLNYPSSWNTDIRREEAAMANCTECENILDIELDEVAEGDVIVCDECGTEYEVVGVDPLELTRVSSDLDEDDVDLLDEEEEEE